MQISDTDLKNLLVGSGKVAATALKEAEADHEKNHEPLAEAVLKHRLISEKDLAKLYAKSLNVPFADLSDIKIPRNVLTKIPERVASKYQAVMFGIDHDKNYQLAMADPEDFQALDFIKKEIGTNLKVYLAAPGDILSVLEQYKGSLDSEITKVIKQDTDEQQTQEVSAKDLTEDSPIAKTVNIILEYAVKAHASDIHIEPREGVVQVRYRIDGILHESMTLPRSILPAVVSRIKILSNLKIDEHRVPQDGRFKVTVGPQTMALRVSTLPVMDGEKVVMRLLDESSRAMTLEELGFSGHPLELIQKGIKKPHGMILVTGPTGSGKSTTLYSILSLLNTPEVNISTVEDPVEYRISGVNQTQVNPKAGMTFANGLRALLRQDTNIIMVGEVRDSETADLAVQAALTGHLVLSTLHTNNAATTLPRLLDMGVEPFLIASTVNVSMAQRLVRKLCTVCRVPYVPEAKELDELKRDFQVGEAIKLAESLDETPTAEDPKPAERPKSESHEKKEKTLEPIHDLTNSKSILERIKSDPNILDRSLSEAERLQATKDTEAYAKELEKQAKDANPTHTAVPQAAVKPKRGQLTLYKAGPGCAQCGPTGYQGRIGIHEVLEVSEEIAKLIVNRASSEDIQLAAVRAGMITMQQDGFIKATQGLTTVEEILRVTRE